MCAERRPPLTLAAARTPADRRRHAGQALVETLVGALVLVPLFLLVAWLGKVQSVREATIAASRIVAFECTVRPDDCVDPASAGTLADEVRRRAFSRADAGILTAERMPDQPAATERNPLWVDRANRPLLERFSDVGVRVEGQHFDAGESLAVARGAGIAADPALLLAEHAGPGRFGLHIAGGLVDAKVQVNLAASRVADHFRTQLDAIPLRIKARTAVLTDAWNASGPYGAQPRSVEARVRLGQSLPSLYEASVDARYLPVRGFISLMNFIGLEPTAGAFSYHRSDVDVVPADRLGGAGVVPDYTRPGGATHDGGGW